MPELKLSAVGFKEKLPIYTNDIIGNPLYTNSLMQYTDSDRLGNTQNQPTNGFKALPKNNTTITLKYYHAFYPFFPVLKPEFLILIPTRYLHH